MRTLAYHPKVPSEVREILAYYEGISAKLADEFWAELGEALKYAQQHPMRHHFDQSGRRRSNLKMFPYHFLFRVFDESVRITAVRHHHQNPKYGVRRL
ncbi:type II toxin-antitoxin system RelE/ParE family toxin [Luteolibacter yonseiensis]|uniref:Type II toxin-antitoxin system RelE/ParE family toxin n=1 Tax=Luteolibacter yonseiensis TaxID=1144680 RepID=A0A934RA41_9BACT|nr:type II toxin-antitoxin system RelE/ParE family toxin [Luteolibacter yonseiensis]MBK1818295.1 type II toxin-antitoxin system RelE/ParE family toxin [Luteolibacter yonseiensis]